MYLRLMCAKLAHHNSPRFTHTRYSHSGLCSQLMASVESTVDAWFQMRIGNGVQERTSVSGSSLIGSFPLIVNLTVG